MPNVFEPERGQPNWQLLAIGVDVVLVTAVLVTALMLKSNGTLDEKVTVTALLREIGDGLPARADVKFRGVLVGSVGDVTPASSTEPNRVHIALDPRYAAQIPDTVTARVVPSNVFAVSSLELVDNGSGTSLRAGAQIAEDTSLPTVLLQTSLTKLRDIIAVIGRAPSDNTVGVLAALATATQGRGRDLVRAGAQLDRMVNELNAVMAPDGGPTTLGSLSTALNGLQTTAPELLDSLHAAVVPMRTVAEKQVQLTDFLSAGQHTFGTLGTALDNNTDRMIAISTQLTPAVGVLADHSGAFVPIATELRNLSDKVQGEFWNPVTKRGMGKFVVTVSTSHRYTRADCPRYGELAGASCVTAPESIAPQPYPAELDPRSYRPPPGLIGGNVGPVGSEAEMEKLGEIVGSDPNAATSLLLGPVARGSTVVISPAPDTEPTVAGQVPADAPVPPVAGRP